MRGVPAEAFAGVLVVLALVEVVGLEAVALGVLAATGLPLVFTAPLPELFEPVAFEVLLVFVAALPLLAPDFSPVVIVVVALAGLGLALTGLALTGLALTGLALTGLALAGLTVTAPTLVLLVGFVGVVLLERVGAVVSVLGLTTTVPDGFAARFAVALVGVIGTASAEAGTLPVTVF